MKILFFCTAFNSLSQRVYLALSEQHYVTIEYALSEELMVEAAELVKPDLIICPFLTTLVPAQVYSKYLTLIVHPGPPGDAGPSALDWLLMGDDGTEPDSKKLLQRTSLSEHGRPYWGVTVLQATADFDMGPVWAFEQFAVDIDQPNITKSSLYRGPVTRAGVAAVLKAVDRITIAADASNAAAAHRSAKPSPRPGSSAGSKGINERSNKGAVTPHLAANPIFAQLSVTTGQPFQGADDGPTRHRPLLRAADRDFDPHTHTALEISRRIRCADSQPGCLSSLFGPKLYLYGGAIEAGKQTAGVAPGAILASRDDAVCVATCDGKGVWITHVRRVKAKTDPALWPKVPAVQGLAELSEHSMGYRNLQRVVSMSAGRTLSDEDEWSRATCSTLQDIWIDFEPAADKEGTVAYVFFDFYNGAMSSKQCRRLLRALQYVLDVAEDRSVRAVVLMGGSYFSNGIHLNVIESAADPALESWFNINAIDDLVYSILHDFPIRGIKTIAAVRGNAAAGGVALATACDIVLAGEDVVFNPAYRAMGLYGSEFHSLTYNARCRGENGKRILRSMMPLSASAAGHLGLVDHVLPGWGAGLDSAVKAQVRALTAVDDNGAAEWKRGLDLSAPALARIRAEELAEMAKDFWSPRAQRYHPRRSDFVRKTKAAATPRRFALHRKSDGLVDEEDDDRFDSVEWFAMKNSAPQHGAGAGLEDTAIPKQPEKAYAHRSRNAPSSNSGSDEKSWGTQEGVPKAKTRGTIFCCYYDAD
ncbi:formyl transferase domain-containing protein [Cordyceps militaris CM01]|uniref:Formyl transferase domain-containing protein n=2 Tax=Cordyceps militaris TaxID=73501 RepID=G3JII7_CORMM|nr:formyl transferase domain-containing protein [Cordyceps militaris CM01]ATY59617.1 formyl transferase domain-containing [Cordyceps militaris]EGX91088.1 formyl transferase domain-containing protein [Cordyceps militaris CM01]